MNTHTEQTLTHGGTMTEHPEAHDDVTPDGSRNPEQHTLSKFMSAAIDLAGVGVELDGGETSFRRLHSVCRHCADESPVLYERCGDGLRSELAAGDSRLCGRGHRIVGYEGGLRVVMPKTMTAAVGRVRGRSVPAGSDRLGAFLGCLRPMAAVIGRTGAQTIGADLQTGDASTADVPAEIPGAFLNAMPQMCDPLLTSMVRTLVAAIDAKDRYTRGHSERVQIVSTKLGQALGLDEVSANDLYWASSLHDIGKIGVPDRILNKKKPLDEEEFASMKEHPELGATMIEPLEWLGNARLGVLHHHERIDGTGYPGGLSGNEIPLIARIIAVADTFDAMVSRRHYRLERSPGEALEELIDVAGSQLDLNVVAAFETSFEEILVALAGATYVAEGLELIDDTPDEERQAA